MSISFQRIQGVNHLVLERSNKFIINLSPNVSGDVNSEVSNFRGEWYKCDGLAISKN